MPITWTSALETGHPVIDSQHKELVSVVDKLLTACQQGQAADKITPTVDYLVSYTKRHFSEEEALQQQSNYPDYNNHRGLHADFVKVIMELSAELKQTGPTPTLINKIVRNVADWLISHIQQQDGKLAAHLKSSGA
ncbi:MAG: hemerythrin family protein [Planctomycetaceae bacterium]|nr:hemerythrin family protein [Planctomycetaceae bacterium]